jgi:uncharacterized Fe-S cluster-containing MiaB family protein
MPSVRELSFESLPIFVTDEALSDLRTALPHHKINVGIGLDCSDEWIRRTCILKGIPDSSYRESVQICRTWNICPRAYIVVKPPFLAEAEAVYDAAHAAVKALRMGFGSISFEPIALQRGTLQLLLASYGLYEPPTVWTVLSTLLFLGRILPPRLRGVPFAVGGEVFTPIPLAPYARCRHCESRAIGLIRRLPFHVDLDVRADLPPSSVCCSADITSPCQPVPEEIGQRITDAYWHLHERRPETLGDAHDQR